MCTLTAEQPGNASAMEIKQPDLEGADKHVLAFARLALFRLILWRAELEPASATKYWLSSPPCRQRSVTGIVSVRQRLSKWTGAVLIG